MSKLANAILPAYLFLCLLLGGSTQGVWGNAILQLLGVAILAWALLTRDPQPIAKSGRRLLAILGALALLFLLQLIPLPPAIWMGIPGREFIAQGFDLLGMDRPWQPLSLAPYDTMATALTLLPPAAILIAMLRLRQWSAEVMFAAIVVGALVSILLGVLQVGSDDSSWYLYPVTNLGAPVGAFANANHFATLMLVTVPVLTALALGRWRAARKKEQRAFALAIAGAAGAMLAAGLLMCESAAVLLIGPPVAMATVLLALRLDKRRVRMGLAGVALLIAVAAAALVAVGRDLPGWGTNASIETRAEYWSKSFAIMRNEGFTGSGLGTFQKVYRHYEDPAAVDRFYANHAHNDYVEIALEGGVPAILLLALFLAWWLGRAGTAWLSPVGLEQKAAVVASAAILLHSAFDFPLRMTAIAAAMAVFFALLAGARSSPAMRRNERDPVRHATL